MDEVTLEQRKMETLRELSQAEMKVNEAKATLQELKERKNAFLQERENETLLKIKETWKESSEIVSKIGQNYEQVHTFFITIKEIVKFLEEAQENFGLLVADFNEHSKLWNEEAEKERQRLVELREKVDYDALVVSEGKKTLERQRQNNEKELGRIASRQKQIKAALEEIKKHR